MNSCHEEGARDRNRAGMEAASIPAGFRREDKGGFFFFFAFSCIANRDTATFNSSPSFFAKLKTESYGQLNIQNMK
eukprot:gene27162-biopygen7013